MPGASTLLPSQHVAGAHHRSWTLGNPSRPAIAPLSSRPSTISYQTGSATRMLSIRHRMRPNSLGWISTTVPTRRSFSSCSTHLLTTHAVQNVARVARGGAIAVALLPRPAKFHFLPALSHGFGASCGEHTRGGPPFRALEVDDDVRNRLTKAPLVVTCGCAQNKPRSGPVGPICRSVPNARARATLGITFPLSLSAGLSRFLCGNAVVFGTYFFKVRRTFRPGVSAQEIVSRLCAGALCHGRLSAVERNLEHTVRAWPLRSSFSPPVLGALSPPYGLVASFTSRSERNLPLWRGTGSSTITQPANTKTRGVVL